MTPWHWLLIVGLSIGFYGYAGYPVLLIVVRLLRRQPPVVTAKPAIWPRISITLPAYNAEKTLRPVLDGLVKLE